MIRLLPLASVEREYRKRGMFLKAALKALRQLPDPGFRRVLLRALLLTLGLLIGFGALAWWGLSVLATIEIGWLDLVVELLLALGLLIGAVFLIFPVAALLIGLLLDEVAERVEARHYPNDPPGQELSWWKSLATALRFMLVVIGVNLLLLPLYFLLPGVNVMVFYLANGYLLGREYFELVAYRHLPEVAVHRLRRRSRARLLLAGLIIAIPLSVPIVNLLVPLFATAFMVHVFKALAGRGQQIEAV